jgi:hypothetical protein
MVAVDDRQPLYASAPDEMCTILTEASAQGERGGPGEAPRDAPAVQSTVGISHSQAKAI